MNDVVFKASNGLWPCVHSLQCPTIRNRSNHVTKSRAMVSANLYVQLYAPPLTELLIHVLSRTDTAVLDTMPMVDAKRSRAPPPPSAPTRPQELTVRSVRDDSPARALYHRTQTAASQA